MEVAVKYFIVFGGLDIKIDTTKPLLELIEKHILDEYKHELFTEYGHRFFDLKRWNRLNELQNSIPTWKPFMEKLPLPEKEILLNNNLKPQNDGY